MGIDVTFDESVTFFYAYIQDFFELRPPENSSELYEPLKYVYRHDSDLCEELGSQRHRGFRSKGGIFFYVNLEIGFVPLLG